MFRCQTATKKKVVVLWWAASMSLTKFYSSPRPGANPSFNNSSPSPEGCCNDPDDESRPRIVNIRDTLQRNTGLFLITLSQSCFSSMNVAVKKLNSLDIPVPTMEVCVISSYIHGLNDCIAHCCSNGSNRSVLLILYASVPWHSQLELSSQLIFRIVTGVNDPFLGPKDLRLLLLLRGIAGWVKHRLQPRVNDIEWGDFFRFVGLTGLYLSLQYLSLSDATVLTFLAPICLVFTGAIFLGESFSLRQVFAGRKQSYPPPESLNFTRFSVVSLGGVILIARPTFLFGPSADIPHFWIDMDPIDSVVPTDRIISVW